MSEQNIQRGKRESLNRAFSARQPCTAQLWGVAPGSARRIRPGADWFAISSLAINRRLFAGGHARRPRGDGYKISQCAPGRSMGTQTGLGGRDTFMAKCIFAVSAGRGSTAHSRRLVLSETPNLPRSLKVPTYRIARETRSEALPPVR